MEAPDTERSGVPNLPRGRATCSPPARCRCRRFRPPDANGSTLVRLWRQCPPSGWVPAVLSLAAFQATLDAAAVTVTAAAPGSGLAQLTKSRETHTWLPVQPRLVHERTRKDRGTMGCCHGTRSEECCGVLWVPRMALLFLFLLVHDVLSLPSKKDGSIEP